MTQRTGKLLCVDDEENILASLRRCFSDEDFEVVCATSGAAAFEILENEEIAVVLSDQRMPGMSGTDFLREVRSRWPETMRIILSGFAELSVVVAAINDGEINKFIAKPWSEESLKETIRACFHHYDLQAQTRMMSERIKEQNDSLRAFNADLELRNTALEVYQELLDQMPVAVLGIGTDGMVALANGEGRDLFARGEEQALGAHYRTLLPKRICDEVGEALAGNEARRARVTIDEPFSGSYDALIQPLRPSARERGLLVVFYPLMQEGAR